MVLTGRWEKELLLSAWTWAGYTRRQCWLTGTRSTQPPVVIQCCVTTDACQPQGPAPVLVSHHCQGSPLHQPAVGTTKLCRIGLGRVQAVAAVALCSLRRDGPLWLGALAKAKRSRACVQEPTAGLLLLVDKKEQSVILTTEFPARAPRSQGSAAGGAQFRL